MPPRRATRYHARMQSLLMIEDDARLAQMVGEYLERSGFAVTHAIDAKAGLALLTEPPSGHLPELVIRLLDAGERVGSYVYDGLWLDIGRQDDFEKAVVAYEGMRLQAEDTALDTLAQQASA